MRWQSRKQKFGDVQIITRFLLFPKCINGEWRWLEKASWRRLSTRDYNLNDYWDDLYWLDETTRHIICRRGKGITL